MHFEDVLNQLFKCAGFYEYIWIYLNIFESISFVHMEMTLGVETLPLERTGTLLSYVDNIVAANDPKMQNICGPFY